MTGSKRWKKVMAFILAILLMIQVTEDYTLVIRAENEIDNQNETVLPQPIEESPKISTGEPTEKPTIEPTVGPTTEPTTEPTVEPTTGIPTEEPQSCPSATVSETPESIPSGDNEEEGEKAAASATPTQTPKEVVTEEDAQIMLFSTNLLNDNTRESVSYVSIKGTISYNGEGEWEKLLRPHTFSGEIRLKAYNESDNLIGSYVADTNPGSNFYLAFVHDGNGGGEYTITNVPTSITIEGESQAVKRYEVIIPSDGVYGETVNKNVTFTDTEESNKVSFLNVDLARKPITAKIIVSKELYGDDGTGISFGMKLSASNGSNSAETSISVMSGNSKEIEVPVSLTYTLKETPKTGYPLVGYQINDGELSQNCQVSVSESEDTKIKVVNASYNRKVAWQVKWVDNHHTSDRPDPDQNFKLQYKTGDGEYQTITEDDLISLGLSAVPMAKKKNVDLVQQDTEYYSFEGLPAVTASGESITYRVTADDIDAGDNKYYMVQWDEAHSVATLTYAEPFSVTMNWSDAATSEKRPSAGTIINSLNLYHYTDQTYTKESIDGKLSISENGNVWTISYDGLLPKYTQENNSLTYVLVQGTIAEDGTVTPINIPDKDGYTGTYQTTYNNGTGSFANQTDRCYNGQKIIQTLTGTTNCTATKEWKDQTGDLRPAATVTLWRYSMKDESDTEIDMTRSARVIVPGVSGDVLMSYSLTTAGVISNASNGTEEIDFLAYFKTTNQIDGDYQFPKYDELGREYRYFIQEIMTEGGSTAQYQTTYQSIGETVDENGVFHGGKIINTKVDELAIKVNKKWNVASSLTDLEGKKITFELVGKKQGTNEIVVIPVLEGNTVISGFGSEQTTGSTEFLVNPYDENGQPYEILGIREKEITGINEDSLSANNDNPMKVTFTIGDNSYVGTCGEAEEGTSSLYGTKQYTYQVTNTINRNRDYTIVKRWGENVDLQDLTFTLTAKSINPANSINTIYTVNFEQSSRKVTITGDGKTDTFHFTVGTSGEQCVWTVQINGILPMYDEDGYLINYYVTENQPERKKWTHTSYSRTDSATTVTNYIGTEGTTYYMYVNKVWNDDGDAAHRQDVLVQVCDADGNSLSDTEGAGSYQAVLKQGNLWEAWIQVPDKPETAGYTIKEIKVGNYNVVENGSESTVTTDTCSYKVTYKNNSANSVTITNTRTGKVDVEITKNWVDGNNKKGNRPNSLTFLIKNKDTGESVKEVTLSAGSHTVADNSNQWKIKIEDLDKYDANGKLITYVIEEKQDETESDVHYTQTASILSYGEGTEAGKTLISYSCTNKLQGETSFTVHKRWNDKATGGKTRPDLYLTLHQVDTEKNDESADSVYTDYKNQKWEAGNGSSTYNWKITIEKLPAYNENGYPYEYYVVETMNDNGASTGLTYEAVYCKSKENDGGPDMDSPNTDSEGNPIEKAYNGDYIVNTLSGNMTVEGEKIWKNTEGYKVNELPNLQINLKRRTESQQESEARDITYLILNGQEKTNEAKNYGDTSKTKFVFTVDGSGDPLPQYDENGERYIYTLEEVIPQESEFLYVKENKNNSLVNTFNVSDNKRSISVTKYWDRSKIPTDAEVDKDENENQYPTVTLNLYRYKKPADGETLTVEQKKAEGILKSITINAQEFKRAAENSGDGSVTVSFDNLLIYSPNGSKYYYFIEEKPIKGYSTHYYLSQDATGEESSGGIDIIDDITLETPAEQKQSKVSVKNSYDENQYQTISLSGVKVWDDYNNFFKYRPDEITVTLSRYAGNQNNKVENVNVKLSTTATDDGTPYISWNRTNQQKDKGKDIWSYTIYNLRRYAPNGETYVYKLVEQQDSNKYYGNGNTTVNQANDTTMSNCTNAFAASCYVRKNWIDGDNKYGFRPTSITVVLQRSTDGVNWENVPNPNHKDGDSNPIYMQAVLDEEHNAIPNTNGSSWQYTFTNLPKYELLREADTGTPREYQYRCIETFIGGTPVDNVDSTSLNVSDEKNIGSYTRSYEFNKNKTVITNSMNATRLQVTKEWDDTDNLYQARPEKLQFYLQKTTATPEEISTGGATWMNAKDAKGEDIILTLSSGDADSNNPNKWVKTFDSLPVSDNGETLTLYYRAVEITDSADGADSKHPKLTGQGETGTGETVYKNYQVTQDGSETESWNYNEGTARNESTIKNKLIVSTNVSTISVEKIWRNDDKSAAYDVTFELQKKEGEGAWESFSPAVDKTIKKDNATQKVTFENLPAVNANGQTIEYQVIEKTKDSGYKSILSEPITDASTKTKSYTCTNVQLMDFTVSKVWKDNQNGLIPNGAKGYVSEGILQQKTGADGTWSNAQDASGKNFTFSITGDTSKKFTGLPRYTETGERIYYQGLETKVNGVAVADNNGANLTNASKSYQVAYDHQDTSTAIANTLVTVPIQITKVWDDNDDHDHVRPEDITLTLYADYDGDGSDEKQEVDSLKYTIDWDKTNVSNKWTATITGLPRYAADGQTEIIYSLEETLSGDAARRYFTTIDTSKPEGESGNWNFTITNTLNLLITLKKHEQVDGALITGAEFKLYQLELNGDSYERRADDLGTLYTTDENGEIQILIDKIGVYELEETKAATGYITPMADNKPALVIQFTVTDSDLRQTKAINTDNESFFTLPTEYSSLLTQIGLANERKKGILKIYKKDGDTGAALDGVTFTLYKKSEGNIFDNAWDFLTGKTYKVYAQAVEDTSGVTTIEDLEWGKYKLVETATLDGYSLTGEEYFFTVDADTVESPIELSAATDAESLESGNVITNYRNKLHFIKQSAEETPITLSGGSYRIMKVTEAEPESREEVSFDTDAAGTGGKKTRLTADECIYGLPVGTYEIEELTAPAGYLKNTTPVTFSIDAKADGTAWTDNCVIMQDKPVELSVQKRDADQNLLLSGAEFSVTGIFATYGNQDASASTISGLTTDNVKETLKGKLIVSTGETEGDDLFTYQLKETKAPEGYSPLTESVSFKVTEEGVVLLQTPGLVSADNSGDVPVIIVGNTKDTCSFTVTKEFKDDENWKDSIRPSKVTLQLYAKIEGQDGTKTPVGQPVIFEIAKDRDTYTYTFENLPTHFYSTENGSIVSKKLCYFVEETAVVPENLGAYYTTRYSEVTQNGSTYSQTVTNTAEALSPSGKLKISKTNSGGAQAAEFRIKVTLTYNRKETVFKDSYEVYGANDELLRSVKASEGYVVIKGGEHALLELPKGASYHMEEELETIGETTQYDPVYTNQSGTITENVLREAQIVNKAKIYTAIENQTENEGENQQNKKNAGGMVGVVTENQGQEAYDKVDYQEGKLSVYWLPETDWQYTDSFTVTYREYDGSAGGGSDHQITVTGFLNEDGSPKGVSDSCYAELKERYPEMEISQNEDDGAIVLRLANTVDGMPYLNKVDVTFLPTIAVINTTTGSVGGQVKAETGSFSEVADGKGVQGENRYPVTRVYAKADPGYMIDLSGLEIGNVNAIELQDAADATATTFRRTRSVITKSVLALDGGGNFSVRLPYTIAGIDDDYAICGKVDVLQNGESGYPSVIAITLMDLPIPVDIGIPFVTAPKKVTSGDKDDKTDSTQENAKETDDGSAIAALKNDKKDMIKEDSGAEEDGTQKGKRKGTNTGDDGRLLFWLLLLCLSGTTAGLSIRKLLKKKTRS